MTSDVPDRIGMNMTPDYIDRYGRPFVTSGPLMSSPSTSVYLRATPARLHAEELVDALREVDGNIAWWISAMGDWDRGGPEALTHLHNVADKIDAILARIEQETT